MIEIKDGDLFESKVDAIVNAVNCIGVMGRGIALQFKYKYPDICERYQRDALAGKLKIGSVRFYPILGPESGPKYVVKFPTKTHWRYPSQLNYIELGLVDLVSQLQDTYKDVKSIAMPALGCGLGGLCWDDVYPLIDKAFSEVTDIRVEVFKPW